MHSIISVQQVLVPSTSLFSFSSSTTFTKAKLGRKLLFPASCSLEPISSTTSSSTSITCDTAMATSPAEEVAQDFSPFLKIYKDGHIERLVGVEVVPPSLDPETGVESKDVVISPDVSARLFAPKHAGAGDQKLPLVLYFHGGGFCVETPFCAKYHNAVKTIVAESSVVAVSVHYRLAPENPIPIPYDDSWAAFEWAASHSEGTGPDEWLNARADFRRVILAGDSAGANIAHNLALRAGVSGSPAGVNLIGIVLIHPYFWGLEPIGNEPKEAEKRAMAEGIWRFSYPATENGTDDPWMNPAKDPNFGRLGCGRVLVFVAEKDGLRDRGWYYKELLEKSEWGGTVEVVEAKGDDHVFHLSNPTSDNAVSLVKKIASFANEEK